MKQAWVAALLAVVMVFAAPAVMLREASAQTGAEQAAETQNAENASDEAAGDAGEDNASEAQDDSTEDEENQASEDEETLQGPADAASSEEAPQGPAVPASAEESGPVSYDRAVWVTLLDDGAKRVMSLWEYLTGVVAGEMTAAFSDDALMAQAVAARTYALRQLASGKHDGCLCADPGCCQDWCDPEEKAQTSAGADLVRRAGQAVTATDGWVLTYEGQLIEAVYHSCSGGRTETASEVWGGDCPYLLAVDSPGEDFAPRFSGRVSISAADLGTLLNSRGVTLPDRPEDWFGAVSYTAGGGVADWQVGDTLLSGAELRSLLGLNSTRFTLEVRDGSFLFETQGFGHRVGLSQYGAEAMARAGSDWREILTHYYTGVTLLRRTAEDAARS